MRYNIINTYNNHPSLLKTTFESHIDIILDRYDDTHALEGVGETVSSAFKTLLKWFSELWDKLKKAFRDRFHDSKERLKKTADEVKENESSGNSVTLRMSGRAAAVLGANSGKFQAQKILSDLEYAGELKDYHAKIDKFYEVEKILTRIEHFLKSKSREDMDDFSAFDTYAIKNFAEQSDELLEELHTAFDKYEYDIIGGCSLEFRDNRRFSLVIAEGDSEEVSKDIGSNYLSRILEVSISTLEKLEMATDDFQRQFQNQISRIEMLLNKMMQDQAKKYGPDRENRKATPFISKLLPLLRALATIQISYVDSVFRGVDTFSRALESSYKTSNAPRLKNES